MFVTPKPIYQGMDSTANSSSQDYEINEVVHSKQPLIDKRSLQNIYQTQNDIQAQCRLNPELKGKRYMGKNKGFLWYKNEPLITIGPHFPLFLISFAGFTIFGLFVGLYGTASVFWRVLVFGSLGIQILSYLYVALANPGLASAIDPDHEQLKEFSTYTNYCSKCGIVRDTTMIHCNECDICIKDYDHHCPWTGKCIGKANLSGFYVFFFASCALIFVCFAAIIASIWLLETE